MFGMPPPGSAPPGGFPPHPGMLMRPPPFGMPFGPPGAPPPFGMPGVPPHPGMLPHPGFPPPGAVGNAMPGMPGGMLGGLPPGPEGHPGTGPPVGGLEGLPGGASGAMQPLFPIGATSAPLARGPPTAGALPGAQNGGGAQELPQNQLFPIGARVRAALVSFGSPLGRLCY